MGLRDRQNFFGLPIAIYWESVAELYQYPPLGNAGLMC